MFKFKIKVANPQASFEKAKSAIKNAGANMSGDQKSGSFSGSGLEGSYAFNAGELEITIDKKPFLVPESIIKNKVAEFFG